MRRLLTVLVLGLVSGVALAKVSATHAWIAEAPPAAAVLGGYMQLHNDGDAPVALIAISSPAFSRVELHRSMEMDGMARMQPQARIVVPAHGQIMLQPGGYHLMLMQPKQRLLTGDSVPLSLRFDDGQILELTAPVRKQTAAGMQHQGH